MGTKTDKITIPDEWSNLVKLWPLRPIRDQANYDKVLEVADELTTRTELNEDQTDYFESLTALIETYKKDIGAGSGTANGQLRFIDIIDDLFAGEDIFFRLVCVAKDVMKKDIKTLTLDDKIETCLKFMKDNKVRHVPVMDPPTEEGAKPFFVGIVSGRDLSRLMSPYLGKVGEEDVDRKLLKEPLIRIVTRKPLSVSPETPMLEVLLTMIDNHIDMVPVLTNGDIVGIVTSTDILNLLIRLNRIQQIFEVTGEVKAQKRLRLIDMSCGEGHGNVATLFSSSFKMVQDVMTEQPVCLEKQDTLAKAIEVMKEGKFRHLPIVDSQRRLVGIVSDRDILSHLSHPPEQKQPEDKGFRNRLFMVDPKDKNLSLPLANVMTRDIMHAVPSYGFFNAVKMLDEKKISCLPVVDEEENFVGILTVNDVMRALLTAYELSEKSQANPEPMPPSVGMESQEKQVLSNTSIR